MRLIVATAVIASSVATGCGKSDKPSATSRSEGPSALQNLADGAHASEENEAKAIADVNANKTGALFPRAEEAVKKSAREQLGNAYADKAAVKAENVEDFGEKKWKVTGTYSGPDRNGKAFTSHWTVGMEVMMGGLQTTTVSLGKMEYAK